MKAPLVPLATAFLFLTTYTYAAPTTVRALDPSYETPMSRDLLSPRSANYSPASDRRTAPVDICQSGQPDSTYNPICNPNNYSRVSPSNGGGEGNDSTSSSTLNGRPREGRVKRQSLLNKRRLQRAQEARGVSLVNRNRDGEGRIDPQASRSEQKRYVSQSGGIENMYTKEGGSRTLAPIVKYAV
ncbi:hypothetical protein EDD21DRAFT_429633 [Dissophora ornata]|nr:hypothetical protein EDD21DRAFT_429633 [Dissophora ornata]